jgi:hypothetical protein
MQQGYEIFAIPESYQANLTEYMGYYIDAYPNTDDSGGSRGMQNGSFK